MGLCKTCKLAKTCQHQIDYQPIIPADCTLYEEDTNDDSAMSKLPGQKG